MPIDPEIAKKKIKKKKIKNAERRVYFGRLLQKYVIVFCL